ncbi:general substrate transporter [Thozetella sp. PMI_491]|nr:general substrate transporter [Thozetella sp. PMI_491]
MATPRSAWSMVTPMLLFSSFCLLVGDMLFGYDTASFGGVLANPGFIAQFGSYDPTTKTRAFDSLHTSLLTSLAFIGKFLGCFIAGPMIEKFGHRIVFFIIAAVSAVGITAADTDVGTGRYAQFIIGRIIVYISVGLVEVDVTTYQSEIVPGPFRGLVVVSLQLFLNAGTLIATGVNKAFSTDTSPVGWKTVTGIQFIFAACRSSISFPIRAIKGALRENVHKSPWLDLFRGSNFRRTMIVIVFYFFQQATGQAFVSSYQTVFYKTNGYAAYAFTYPIINSCLILVSVIPGMYAVDKFGRRHTLLLSFFLQCFFMFLLAGLGEKDNRSPSENNMVVASFMLYAFFYNMGGASIPYLLGSEIPNSALREKTQSLGAAWNVIWAFVTNFAIPYMINSIHFQVGWVFGVISFLALVFTFFFLPETKGYALEEIDAIFAVSYNPFRSFNPKLTDAERRVGQLEAEKDTVPEDYVTPTVDNDKPQLAHQPKISGGSNKGVLEN